MEQLRVHIEDLLIIWSKLCPECNYLKLLEVVCHVANFRIHGIQTACRVCVLSS